MVVPNRSSLTRVGNRCPSPNSLKHNGQRWYALAVLDYESRALRRERLELVDHWILTIDATEGTPLASRMNSM